MHLAAISVPDLGSLGLPAQIGLALFGLLCGAWCFREGMMLEKVAAGHGWVQKVMLAVSVLLVMLGLSPLAVATLGKL